MKWSQLLGLKYEFFLSEKLVKAEILRWSKNDLQSYQRKGGTKQRRNTEDGKWWLLYLSNPVCIDVISFLLSVIAG